MNDLTLPVMYLWVIMIPGLTWGLICLSYYKKEVVDEYFK